MVASKVASAVASKVASEKLEFHVRQLDEVARSFTYFGIIF